MVVNILGLSKAFSDKNRIKILQMLSKGGVNVTTVADNLNVEENLASHHLRVLASLGFLKSQKKGREVYYDINKSKLISLFKALNKNEAFKEILEESIRDRS